MDATWVGPLHHVTVLSGDPVETLEFYEGVLGLRLVKRTVNFDDPGTYHLYFGDELGRPGTILTFFPWPFAVPGQPGPGQTTAVRLRVEAGSLPEWKTHLEAEGIKTATLVNHLGTEALAFTDPHGLALELVAQGPQPDAGETRGPLRVHGLAGVTLTQRELAPTARVLEFMGYSIAERDANRVRFHGRGDAQTCEVDVTFEPDAPRGRVSKGSVHHIAFRLRNDEAQADWRARLAGLGLPVSPVMDRKYFRSIYFNEPGGVLFELATDGPGFAVDEPADQLGRVLQLPPQYESRRAEIEAHLQPLPQTSSRPPEASKGVTDIEPRLEAAQERLAEAEAAELRFANLATVLVFGALLLLLVGTFGWHALPPGPTASAAAIALLPIVVLRARSARLRRRAGYSVDWLERAKARLSDQYIFGQPDGSEYVGREHEYAYDLDLFGPHSIFERLNACHTALGRDALAGSLEGTNDVADLGAPQAAVRELVDKIDYRETLELDLRALVERSGPDADALADQTRGLVTWARGTSPEPCPGWVVAATRVMPFVAVAGAAAWLGLGWPWWVAALPYGANIWIASRVRDLSALTTVFEGVRTTLTAWADTVEHAAGFRLEAPLLHSSVGRLADEGAPQHIRRLSRLADRLSQRRNAFWAMTGNIMLLSDVRARNALAAWHAAHGPALAEWMESVARLEAWASLAAYAESTPDAVWPEHAADGPMITAEEITHPLLPRATRVGNDATLVEAGATWVVTGSNMSGKSTFLRALGLGIVFARLGLPVPARRLRVRDLQVVTSMKVEESLHAGSSRFHAEVRRLRQCLDWAAVAPSLVLLDEILGGTNSAERRIGTIAVLERLRELDAVTLVSTHDLGLSDVLDEWTSETRVIYFTDRVEDGRMIFDYRLKDGRLPSTNALEVMRVEGIPVKGQVEA